MLFFQALVALFVCDMIVSFRPFKVFHSTIKQWTVANTFGGQDTIDRVCAAVNYACVWYPKHALCLQRSFALTYLLRKHGVAAHLILGAQKLPFKAHAWVEVNGQALNERSDVQAIYSVWERC